MDRRTGGFCFAAAVTLGALNCGATQAYDQHLDECIGDDAPIDRIRFCACSVCRILGRCCCCRDSEVPDEWLS